MRRSSRIQIKQENTTAPKCDPLSAGTKRTVLLSIENQPFTSGAVGSRVSKRRDLKISRKTLGSKGNTARDPVEKGDSGEEDIPFKKEADKIEEISDRNQAVEASISTAEVSTSGGEVLTLLAQEESVFSDVANSIKIDRTIKNLSPKKFYLNKNGKTTRSGRSFSPYDFATYALLFGNPSGGSGAQKQRSRKTANPVRKLSQSRKSRGKKRNREQTEQKRSKAKNHRSRQYRRRNKVYIVPVEIPIEPVGVSSPSVSMKTEQPDLTEDLYSEEAMAAFVFDFPPTPVSQLEGHSLPPDFYKTYEPVAADDAGALSPICSAPTRKWEQSEMDALSKISLSDADKYEFRSVFKDVQAQVANFESQSGHDVPGGDARKFDLMESENVEGRRFYRKRITDSSVFLWGALKDRVYSDEMLEGRIREACAPLDPETIWRATNDSWAMRAAMLIAWHKYNLTSSTRYLNDADPPAHARPIIKVRSNQCQKADLVWRLNQTLPPPSIEDVLNVAKNESGKSLKPSPKGK